jgi:hypothetical protein
VFNRIWLSQYRPTLAVRAADGAGQYDILFASTAVKKVSAVCAEYERPNGSHFMVCSGRGGVDRLIRMGEVGVVIARNQKVRGDQPRKLLEVPCSPLSRCGRRSDAYEPWLWLRRAHPSGCCRHTALHKQRSCSALFVVQAHFLRRVDELCHGHVLLTPALVNLATVSGRLSSACA